MAGNEKNGTRGAVAVASLIVSLVVLTAGVAGSWYSLSGKIDLLDMKLDNTTREIRREMNIKTGDRWSKADDCAYMREYSRENNLKTPEHERIVEVGGWD